MTKLLFGIRVCAIDNHIVREGDENTKGRETAKRNTLTAQEEEMDKLVLAYEHFTG